MRKVAIIAGMASVGSTMASQIARQAKCQDVSIVEREEDGDQKLSPFEPEPFIITNYNRDMSVVENRQQRRKKQKYINKPKSKFHK